MNSTSVVMMIEPVNFRFNDQKASTNAFMKHEADIIAQEEALKQFNNYVAVLKKHGIKVISVKDTPDPITPDSIFPNNWFSTHSEGQIVLYPMYARNRRNERKQAVLDSLAVACPGSEIIDLTSWEDKDEFLEWTGSLALDRVNKIAYASMSPRTSMDVLDEICRRMGYKCIVFNAVDDAGTPIYHTNVMMCVGTGFAVLCEDSISSEEELNRVKLSLERSGKEIIGITLEQMSCFAGNMLELNDGKGNTFIIMSQTARNSLTQIQVNKISEFGSIICVDIHTIETNDCYPWRTSNSSRNITSILSR